MKKILICLLAFTLVFSSVSTVAFAQQEISVIVDGKTVEFTDVAPLIDGGRTLVPVRAIFEAIGAQVSWDDSTKTVTSEKGDTKVSLKINDNVLNRNEEKITLDVPAKIIDSRTMVPVRAISEAYNCSVTWNGDKKTVIVITDIDNVEMLNINGESISVAYFNYCLSQVESYAAQSFNCSFEDIKKMWNTSLGETSFGEYLIDMTIDHAILLKSVRQYAQKNDIKLSVDEIDNVDAIIASIKSQLGSDEDYAGYLNMCGSTHVAAEAYYLDNAYVDRVYSVFRNKYKTSDKDVKKYLDQNYVCVKHVLLSTQGLSEQEMQLKKAIAEEVLKKAKSGINFDKLVAEYGEDPGMTANPNGYLFTKGEMVAEFEKASFNLEVGKISGIVESEYGYHIIKRLPPKYSDEEIEAAGNELVEDKANSSVLDIKNATKTTLTQTLIDVVVPVGA